MDHLTWWAHRRLGDHAVDTDGGLPPRDKVVSRLDRRERRIAHGNRDVGSGPAA